MGGLACTGPNLDCTSSGGKGRCSVRCGRRNACTSLFSTSTVLYTSNLALLSLALLAPGLAGSGPRRRSGGRYLYSYLPDSTPSLEPAVPEPTYLDLPARRTCSLQLTSPGWRLPPRAPSAPPRRRRVAQESKGRVHSNRERKWQREPAPTPTRGPLLTASSHGATVGEPSTPQSGPVIRVHGHGASSPLTVPETRRQLSSCLTDCGCGKDGDGHAAACTGSPAQHPPALAASTSGHEGLARQRRCLRPSRRPIPVLHERGARRVVRLAGQTRWRNRGYIEGHKSGAVHRRASPCIATHRQPFS